MPRLRVRVVIFCVARIGNLLQDKYLETQLDLMDFSENQNKDKFWTESLVKYNEHPPDLNLHD